MAIPWFTEHLKVSSTVNSSQAMYFHRNVWDPPSSWMEGKPHMFVHDSVRTTLYAQPYSMLGGSGNLTALLSLKTEQNPLDGC